MAVADRVFGRPASRAERMRRRRARATPQAMDRRQRSRAGRQSAQAVLSDTRPRLRRSGRPRRRRDLALFPDLGVEIRLPALPALRLGQRALAAAMLGVWLLIVHAAWTAPQFRVEGVEVIGAELLRQEHVRSIAGVTGDRAFSVDPKAIRARLEAYPEVASAQVKLRWPNQVQIRITERQPVLAWQDGGRTWWLSRAGVAYLARQQRPGMATVISPDPALAIQDDPMAPALDPELVRLAVSLSELYPSVGPLVYDKIHGLGFPDPRGWAAFFGTDGDIALKVRMYETIADSLAGQAISLISVENLYAPYYRLKR